MNNYKILVTGGAGYIGSHTIVELVENNFDVICVDDLSNSDISVLPKIEEICKSKIPFYKIDLCDKEKAKTIFQQNSDIKGIIHFAAHKFVGESVDKPLKYYKNNILSLVNIIELAEEFNVSNFVFSSSCTVYGQPNKLPIKEKSKISKAFSPYGNTKIISEDILRDYSKQNQNFKTILLRYFNPIGAHHSGLIGELPIGVPSNLLPFITQTAIGIRNELKVFGSDYNTQDGTAIRDYIHVVDLANAHVKALERMLKKECKTNIETFNIGTGNGFTVLEVLKAFIEKNKVNVPYVFANRREGDIEKIWADTTFANKILKWKATKNLSDMVEDAWRWELNYRNKK